MTHNYTQLIIRPFRAWALSLPILVTQLLSAPVMVGCGGDSNKGDESDAVECAPVGQSVPCECKIGFAGTKVCLSNGTYSSCGDCYELASRPCTDPGVEFSCACSNGGTGKQVCLIDGTFNKCNCASAGSTASSSAVPASTLGIDAAAAAAAAAAAGACPSEFKCTSRTADGMTQKVCLPEGSSVPPFCKTVAECTSAGLSSSAMCMKVSGYNVCIQLCN